MADEYQVGCGNWWDRSRNRFDSSGTTSASIATTLNAIGRFGWPMADTKSRSSMDSATASAGGSFVLQGGHDQTSSCGGLSASTDLQMMGLSLASQSMDWNQACIGEKTDPGIFRCLLQEDLSSYSGTFKQEPTGAAEAAASSQQHRRQKQYSGASSENLSVNDFKQINRGFSLDQSQFSSQVSSNDSTITSQSLTCGFQVDSAAAYGHLLVENQQQHCSYQNQPMNHAYPPSGGYGANAAEWTPSSNKYAQFMRSYPHKQPPPLAAANSSPLHFMNNTSFWGASAPAAAAARTDARSSFLRDEIPTAASSVEKPKSASEAGDSGAKTAKKNSVETTSKRSRNESSSPFNKVKKEKMGDRITALQQLVSPFGKTDTASVLSEAIEYIKFLHEQVNALSTPYMKNRPPIQHQQCSEKFKDTEGTYGDLRSGGLCLVPVSSTFPFTHETTVEFWTPKFGGTYR